MSAVRSSRRRSVIASTSMPSMPSVPLMRARPSFSASSTGVETGGGERVGGGDQVAVAVADVALAHQRERAVRERRQVAGAPERAVLVDHRGDAVGQQRRPAARPSPGGRRCGRSRASRAAAASVPGPPRARPPAPTRPRATGPATAAAACAARGRCAGSRARRSRSRRRTPASATPPAPPPLPAPGRSPSVPLSPSRTAAPVTRDRDHVGERDGADPDLDVRVLHDAHPTPAGARPPAARPDRCLGYETPVHCALTQCVSDG